MKKGKRIISSVLATSLLLLTACGNSSSGDVDYSQGNKWIDSDIIGSVSESDNIRLQDDFAAAANKEWILTDGKDIGETYLGHIGDLVNEKKLALLNDDTITGKEAEELKKFSNLASDWDGRATSGVEPIRPYLDYIDNISTVEELYEWITDPVRNPLGIGLVTVEVQPTRLAAYPDEVTIFYVPPQLSLGSEDAYYNVLGANLEMKEQTDEKVAYILGRLNYSDSEINDLLGKNYAME